MFHYLKFFHYYVIVLLGCVCLLFADYFILIGFTVFTSIYVIGDTLLGDDTSTPILTNKLIINAMLYGSGPLSGILLLIAVWLVTPYEWAFMANFSEWIGYDFVQAKQNTGLFELAVAVLFCGLMLSGIATVVGHELVHRIGKNKDVCFGRWLMSLTLDANFSIEHVYNHHAKVATEADSATAPRGRNVYVHTVYAVIGTNKSAWNTEKSRLTRKKQAVLSYHNKVIRGWFMSIGYLLLVGAFAGWQGIVFLGLIGAAGKCFLEIVNYIEHYGLVRHPRQPVKPKHSWNSNRKISTWAMFNLPRHSHHHAQGAVPFEELQPMPEAPMMISGYISTITIALIPPLWFYLMKPKLAQWDANFSNQEELDIIEKQKEKRRKRPMVALFY
ncbi:MAG: fatty acid desaturase [Patiriisocius sp.]|jgi:alkane 1-monooxygenase